MFVSSVEKWLLSGSSRQRTAVNHPPRCFHKLLFWSSCVSEEVMGGELWICVTFSFPSRWVRAGFSDLNWLYFFDPQTPWSHLPLWFLRGRHLAGSRPAHLQVQLHRDTRLQLQHWPGGAVRQAGWLPSSPLTRMSLLSFSFYHNNHVLSCFGDYFFESYLYLILNWTFVNWFLIIMTL